MKKQLIGHEVMMNINDVNLVQQYHKLAQSITGFNRAVTTLTEEEKFKKINASVMIRAVIEEMEERHIPIRDFGYRL